MVCTTRSNILCIKRVWMEILFHLTIMWGNKSISLNGVHRFIAHHFLDKKWSGMVFKQAVRTLSRTQHLWYLITPLTVFRSWGMELAELKCGMLLGMMGDGGFMAIHCLLELNKNVNHPLFTVSMFGCARLIPRVWNGRWPVFLLHFLDEEWGYRASSCHNRRLTVSCLTV